VATLGKAVTARESEVVALLCQHLTNAQIAEALFISERTVESHVAALLRKYEVPDRRSLARIVAAAGGTPARGGLLVPVTAFLGRVAERAALLEILAGHRLVTAVGPGGVGKTRLAISVAADLAEERRDGTWFVDLVRVADPAVVVAAVAEAVGVPERLVASPEAALVASLARRDGLLVLDNCEHLLDGVRACVELVVSGCPGVTVLATSRARLMLAYERVYPVPGLSVTDDDGGDAVALFAARAVEATGEATPLDRRRAAALCRGLDGMALAIELAASRYPTLGLDGLEAGLHDRLRLLRVGGHADDRHRSLRDTIGWSYDLLTPPTRRCCAASPSSRPGARSPPPARSPLLRAAMPRLPTGCRASPITACLSSTRASRRATDCWRRFGSTPRSVSTRRASWPPFTAGTTHGAAPSSPISRPHRPMRRGAPGSTGSSTMPGPRCSGAPQTPTAADRPRNSRPSWLDSYGCVDD
jgi:DNA-binding CsgD family transcriptional regulator